jgi:hypothetical protein
LLLPFLAERGWALFHIEKKEKKQDWALFHTEKKEAR